MRLISIAILKLMGWKIKGSAPEIKKYVLIAAPHTSNWDFVIGRMGLYYLKVRALKVMIKKEFFFFPVGILLKALGAIPVDRRQSAPLVNTALKWFNKTETMALLITPEGTRKRVERWKKGFYFIAEKANVPIVLTYLDYAKKEGGIGPTIYPTGNYEEDLKKIEDFYRDKTARYPENFNLSPKQNKG